MRGQGRCFGHHHHPRRMRRVGHFFRAHLHRRIFAWFGATILTTGLVVGAVMAAMPPLGAPTWREEVARVEHFAGGRFARVWDDPGARAELARAAAEDLHLSVTLVDARGAVLATFGSPCSTGAYGAPVLRGQEKVGEVRVCAERPHAAGAWRLFIALAAAGATIWAASGTISRRLARPMVELARVAGELGRGNLSARVTGECPMYGEAGLLADAMNDMAARIERQLADQRELLAAVSHELRTPLGHVRLLVELARGGASSAVDEIDAEVVELDALVGQLLASSKLDFRTLSPSTVDPADAARRALERAGLDPKLLELEGNPPLLRADPTLLSRALANLLDNARKHGGGPTRLRVRAGDGAAFEVEDRGGGIAPGEEVRIFEPFYRSTAAAPRDPESVSLGLGLALVRRIAEAHGGDAYARNLPAGGALVGFRIRSAGLV